MSDYQMVALIGWAVLLLVGGIAGACFALWTCRRAEREIKAKYHEED